MRHPHEQDDDLSQDARRHVEDVEHHPDQPRHEHMPVDDGVRENDD